MKMNFTIFMTLLSLIVLMSARQILADVYLVNSSNHTISSCYDFPTSFSAKVPSEGLWGHHVFSEPADGCGPLTPPPQSEKTWFAVILHSRRCHNIARALHAQAAGYAAVIIYLNGSMMASNEEGDEKAEISIKVKIPAAVVGLSCIPILEQYQKDLNTFTVLSDNSSENIWLFLVIGVSGLLLVILCSGITAWVIHSCCGKKKSIGLLSRWKLKKLKVHTYQSGDAFEVCAICIEDYQIGDELRILPCAHAFHCKCVDVWLTENRKTCPLCNKAADTRRRQTRHRNNHINESEDERTPLLSDGPSADDHTDEGHEFADDALPGVHVVSPRDRPRRGVISRSVAEVHEEPETSHNRLQNYGSMSTHTPDAVPAPNDGNGSLMAQSTRAPSSLSQDSALSGCPSCPTKFYIGTPRDVETDHVCTCVASHETERA